MTSVCRMCKVRKLGQKRQLDRETASGVEADTERGLGPGSGWQGGCGGGEEREHVPGRRLTGGFPKPEREAPPVDPQP